MAYIVQPVQGPPVMVPKRPSIIKQSRPPKKGCLDYLINPIICSFFLVNFVLWVAGITVLSLGAVAYGDKETMDTLASINIGDGRSSFDYTGLMRNVAIGFMVGGAVLTIIGFLGCCGVAIGNIFFIYLFGVFVIMLILLEMTGLVVVFMYKDSLPETLKVQFEYAVKNYEGESNTPPSVYTEAMDTIHQLFKCCGIANGKDYVRSIWYNTTRKGNQRVPFTCCEKKTVASTTVAVNKRCQIDDISGMNPYTNAGCFEAVKDHLYREGVIAVLISGSLMLLQLIAICCAAVVEKSYRDHEIAHKRYPQTAI